MTPDSRSRKRKATPTWLVWVLVFLAVFIEAANLKYFSADNFSGSAGLYLLDVPGYEVFRCLLAPALIFVIALAIWRMGISLTLGAIASVTLIFNGLGMVGVPINDEATVRVGVNIAHLVSVVDDEGEKDLSLCVCDATGRLCSCGQVCFGAARSAGRTGGLIVDGARSEITVTVDGLPIYRQDASRGVFAKAGEICNDRPKPDREPIRYPP